jgi:hypothetical protein
MKCKICGRRFKLQKENKYLVKKIPTLVECFTDRVKVFECFDCPKCGCQNIVNVREGEDDEDIEEIKDE